MSEYSPCKHCPVRHRNCHASCDEYHAWKAWYHDIRDQIARERFVDSHIKYMEKRRLRGKK